MKKILSILCSFLFIFAIFISGCSSLTNFTNTKAGIIFDGGNSVVVENYLFYANGFASDYTGFSDMGDYNTAKTYAHLSRVNLEDFTSKDLYTSSENVEEVSGGDVVGFGKSYIFAYGQQVYFVAPNVHKTNENKNDFKYLSFFKVNFDGSGRSELFTTENEYDSTNGQMVAIEYGNNAYLIVYDGTKLVSIDITNGGNAKKVNVEATSVALPKEGNAWDGNIYYTKNKDKSSENNDVYKISVAGQNETKITPTSESSYKVTFTGRVGNTIYYTLANTSNSISYSYYASASDISSKRISTAGTVFYKPAVSNIAQINGGSSYSRATGIIFESNSKILYKNTETEEEAYTILDDYSGAKIICNVGTDLYFATSSGIYKTIIGDFENVTTLVSGMTITTDSVGFDLVYFEGEVAGINDIYFFAKRTYSEETADDDKTDENIYLYRMSDKQLLGKTI